MRKRLLVLTGIAVLGCGLAFAETFGEGDTEIATEVGLVHIKHRVTQKLFKMEPEAARLCAPPGRAKAHNPHADYYCHVYITPIVPAQETMESGKGVYPAGTVIVKQKFLDAEGKKPALFTVMRKMKPGYDKEHGDWEYSIVDSTAERVFSRGKTDSCIGCHAAYKETDYVTRAYMRKP